MKLEIRREQTEVGPWPEKDPNWHFIDKQGHEHRWHIPHGANNRRDQGLWRLPTLRAVTFTIHYPDGETGEGVHYYCKRCGERIYPGYRSSPLTRFLAGRPRYYVDGKEIDPREAELILNERVRKGATEEKRSYLND